ncbi:MAG: hypothetical protein LDLANPLL_00226 [Turneriella sp.]|nr:hypothetical protein [Turneriella sp.]
MRFKKITSPGKTLVFSSLDKCYNPFIAYFLKLWKERFATKPDYNVDSIVTQEFCEFKGVPTTPSAFSRFILKQKYKTIIFLNPDIKKDRSLRWASRVALVKNRTGFNPLKGVNPLNLSLPFNTEHHHYVHQLKIFFEHITGEKVREWKTPEFPLIQYSEPMITPFAIIALFCGDEKTVRLAHEFAKLINFVTRTLHVVLILRGELHEVQHLSRTLSHPMTEKALANTRLITNPTEEIQLFWVRHALWVTGTDSLALNFAAFAQTPSLSIFGPLNERVWQPFSTRARILSGEFNCRPCTKYPGSANCTNAVQWNCISGITAELMLATLNGMLSRQARKR